MKRFEFIAALLAPVFVPLKALFRGPEPVALNQGGMLYANDHVVGEIKSVCVTFATSTHGPKSITLPVNHGSDPPGRPWTREDVDSAEFVVETGADFDAVYVSNPFWFKPGDKVNVSFGEENNG
jgi:hypothetical protein